MSNRIRSRHRSTTSVTAAPSSVDAPPILPHRPVAGIRVVQTPCVSTRRPPSPRRASLLLRRRALSERLEESQFVVPAVLVAAAGRTRRGAHPAGPRARPGGAPFVLRSSVDSARSLLGTIAGATISVAALVFSVTVLSVQLASAQFSPR
ncbi:MAG TPA: DUF2254 family protein, partial [Mycobacteriales bacterium]|nr:DUF2254 family protein [Mycobacteriales bacterium]